MIKYLIPLILVACGSPPSDNPDTRWAVVGTCAMDKLKCIGATLVPLFGMLNKQAEIEICWCPSKLVQLQTIGDPTVLYAAERLAISAESSRPEDVAAFRALPFDARVALLTSARWAQYLGNPSLAALQIAMQAVGL